MKIHQQWTNTFINLVLTRCQMLHHHQNSQNCPTSSTLEVCNWYQLRMPCHDSVMFRGYKTYFYDRNAIKTLMELLKSLSAGMHMQFILTVWFSTQRLWSVLIVCHLSTFHVHVHDGSSATMAGGFRTLLALQHRKTIWSDFIRINVDRNFDPPLAWWGMEGQWRINSTLPHLTIVTRFPHKNLIMSHWVPMATRKLQTPNRQCWQKTSSSY